MKKYIKPLTKDIKVNSYNSLLAGSENIPISDGTVDPSTGGDAKEFDGANDDWDSEYEEED